MRRTLTPAESIILEKDIAFVTKMTTMLTLSKFGFMDEEIAEYMHVDTSVVIGCFEEFYQVKMNN